MPVHANPLRNWIAKLLSASNGQALVEASLSASVLMALMFGAVELGRVAYCSIEVADAAKAAIQYGARSTGYASDTTGMLVAIQADTSNFSSASAVTITSGYPKLTWICSDGTAATGLSTDCAASHLEENLTVMTQATIDPLIHLPGLPQTYTLRGYAKQKVFNQ